MPIRRRSRTLRRRQGDRNCVETDQRQIAAQLQQGKDGNKRFIPLAKKLDEEVAQKINKALDMPDVKKPDLPNFAGASLA